VPISVNLTGALLAGPCNAGDAGGLPTGTSNVPITLLPENKPFAVTTGDASINVNSPSAFVTLPGITNPTGIGQVTQAHTLVLHTLVPMLFRLTFTTVATTTVIYTSTIPVQGMLVLEFQPALPLTLLECQGAGQVEYSAYGNS